MAGLRNGAGRKPFTFADGAPIAGTPQRAAVDQLFDPNRQIDYEKEAFGEHPLNWETSLGVSGGNDQTRYLVSGLLKYDGGIARNTYARKQSLRVNLDQNFGPKWLASINGEVLPVQRAIYSPDRWGLPVAAAEPEFVHNAADQYLQTLLVGTTYLGGKVSPSLSILFDWSGSVVVQPNVAYSYDPFRFILNDPRFANVPKILETPKGDNEEMDAINLGILRGLVG